MHYIERDSSGRIIRVAAAPFVGMTEEQQDFTPEMDEWLKKQDAVATSAQRSGNGSRTGRFN